MDRKLLYLSIFVALLSSCQIEEIADNNYAPEFSAEFVSEPMTKTSLSVDESGAGTIYWSASDQIDVFFGSTRAHYTSQNTETAVRAVFKTSDAIGASEVFSNNIWALYPSNSSSNCDGSSVTTSLPSAQYGVPETFDDDLFVSIARPNKSSLQFYNVCGGVKFSLSRDDITSVSFKGNNDEDLAGEFSANFESGVPKATVLNGVKEITLTPKSGGTFAKDVNYYLIVLPGTLSKGFTMTFTTSGGATGTLNYTEKPITIKRSIFSRKARIDTYATFDDAQPNNVIYYTSEDGQVVTPYKDDFGANIVSNEYIDGQGVITFDGNVTIIGDEAFSKNSILSSIIIPSTVESIGNYAFYQCSRLTSAPIPAGVEKIGMYAFGYCERLTTVDVPSSVTTILDFAFNGCSSLTSITIPETVSLIGDSAFGYCISLASIKVDSGNSNYDSRDNCNAIIHTSSNTLITGCKNTIIPSSVIYIGNFSFNGCPGLTSIIIPAGVREIGGAFFTCVNLASVSIPSSVESIATNAFGYCGSLAYLKVDSGNRHYDSRDNSNAIIKTSTNELVAGCKNTVIPSSVTSIGSTAFYGRTGLTSIIIPESVTRIGEYAFFDCSGLTSITVKSVSTPLGSSYMFNDTNDCPIYVPAGSVDAYKAANWWIDYADRIQAIPVPVPEAVDLGLPSGLKWASFNLGASAPEEYGDYYAWGETETKDNYDWSTYKWCNGSERTLTKYNTSSYYGTVDNKIVLEAEDDVAHVKLGGNWRMPTDADWSELYDYTTSKVTSQNGVSGQLFTGKNGNSLFLPAAGYWMNDTNSASEVLGYYWYPSLNSNDPRNAMNEAFIYYSSITFGGGVSRCYGLSVRPVYGDWIHPESVALNKSSLSLTEGGSEALIATVSPVNATSKAVTWFSSDTSVATVSYSGLVIAKTVGTTTITVYTTDGGKAATCYVTVKSQSTPEAVDLGLPSGLKWASFNVGASAPEEYGGFFPWGEIDPGDNYNWSTYKWCSGSANTLTKYNTNSAYGTVDNKAVLDAEDDVAHVRFGGKWRMPTDSDWAELQTECTWKFTTLNGINGWRVIGKNSNSIFLPGYGYVAGMGFFGDYWSSSLHSDSPTYALTLALRYDTVNKTSNVYINHRDRPNREPVRPVYGDKVHPESVTLNESSLSLPVGETAQLTATVSPENISNTNVSWVSSNTSVATVSSDGLVTAVAAGITTITVTTIDGGKKAKCAVTVTLGRVPEAVDLGLPSGIKWASFNMGASVPEEYGGCLAWGETVAEDYYDWSTYLWCNGSANTITKYNTKSENGTVDNKIVLDTGPDGDDLASKILGGRWRMPTDNEWTELRTECTWTWTTLNRVKGWRVTGRNGNSLFLPAAGRRYGSYRVNSESNGYYWSSSLDTGNPDCAWGVYFSSSNVSRSNHYRYYGESIRPVSE